jgi:hypothetical protein
MSALSGKAETPRSNRHVAECPTVGEGEFENPHARDSYRSASSPTVLLRKRNRASLPILIPASVIILLQRRPELHYMRAPRPKWYVKSSRPHRKWPALRGRPPWRGVAHGVTSWRPDRSPRTAFASSPHRSAAAGSCLFRLILSGARPTRAAHRAAL